VRQLVADVGSLDDDQLALLQFGDQLVEAFLVVKRAEWERYQASTTDWELNEYLPFL